MLDQWLRPLKPRQSRLALAAVVLCAAMAPAQAQWFNLGSGLRPDQVEREIAASGYQLTGPVTRNGGVYLADVLGPRGEPQRLLVDATDGRLLQRYRARRAPGLSQGFYPTPGEPIVRPPGLVESPLASEPLVIPGSRRNPADQQVARTEQPLFSIFNLTPAAPVAPEIVEKPKHKPAVVKRRKLDAAPLAQPAALPASTPPAAAAPDALVQTVVAPAPASAPVAAPVVATPPAAEPRVADTKPPVVAPAKPAKPRKPVINDLPVNTLE